MTNNITRLQQFILICAGILIGVSLPFSWSALRALAQTGENCRSFAETGHQVCGRFLEYWTQNGGLAQQGYPLSEPFWETSETNGKPYLVQYFERAVFEQHPENQPPFDVLLSQLGTFLGKRKYTQGFPADTSLAPYYEDRTEPEKALVSFYNAINRKEFERAYSYIGNTDNFPPADQFASGYEHTELVTLAVGNVTEDAGAGNIFASVPVVLNSELVDGSTQMFAGCYTLHRVNEGISDNPNDALWSIVSASISEAPAGSSVDQLLAQPCSP